MFKKAKRNLSYLIVITFGVFLYVTTTRAEPVPKLTYGDFSVQPSGRVHLDAAVFDNDNQDNNNGIDARRLRLGVQGDLSQNFNYKLDVEFSAASADYRDAFIGYTGIKNTRLRLGHIKPPLGLEELASSNDVTLIERASPSLAFVRGQIAGADITHNLANWTFMGGVYNDEIDTTDSFDDAPWSTGFRAAHYLPFSYKNVENSFMHLGASYSYRKSDERDDSFEFGAGAENSIQSKESVLAEIPDAENAQIYGLEAAGVSGPLSVQAEYIQTHIDRNNGASDIVLDGGYIQASWVLTGEQRDYKKKVAFFGSVSPDNPINLKNLSAGGFGAVELVARYSHIDLSDDDIRGGEMNNISFGANWYLNEYTRVMANYIISNTDQDAVVPNDDANIFLMRTQFNF